MKRFSFGVLLLLFVTLFSAVAVWGGAGFITRTPLVYEVRQQLRLVKTGGKVENLKLEVPMFLLNNLPPYQRVTAFRSDTAQLRYYASETAPRMEYTLARWADQRAIEMELVYTIENQAIEYDLPKFSGRNSVAVKYLQPEPGIESTAGAIADYAATLTAGETYPLEKAIKLFYYVNSKLEYKLQNEPSHSALRTLKRGYGNCEDFSLLYIALCRSMGIPARFVTGYRFDPDQIQQEEVDLTKFGHAWVEVNLPGIGWLPVEPTFSYTLNGAKKVNYDFFGRLLDEDRHLLFNYSRNGGAQCTWQHDSRVRTDVKLTTKLLIRRIK